MKKKAIALLLSLTMLSLSTTAYAADTVQNAPTINSSGKLIIENTDITIDSKDLTDLASVINNNATILTNVKDLSEQNETNIATSSDEYSSSKTYKQGDLCIKDGSLYKCTSEITTPEAWNASHWKKISLSDAVNSLNVDVNNLKHNLNDNTITYENGKYYIQAGADTASKKPLGNNPTVLTLSDNFTANKSTVYTRTKSIGTGFSNVKLGINYVSLLATKEYPTDGSYYANVYPRLSGVSYNSGTGVLSYGFRYTTGTSHIGMDNGVKISMSLTAVCW